MEERETELRANEAAMLDKQRAWVHEHFEGTSRAHETVAGKLEMLDRILAPGTIGSSEASKLKCLGVIFGDALAQELGLTWIMLEDEHGRDPALASFGTSIRLFPLDMILKRMEDGEEVDVHELFQLVCDHVLALRADLKGQ